MTSRMQLLVIKLAIKPFVRQCGDTNFMVHLLGIITTAAYRHLQIVINCAYNIPIKIEIIFR